MLHLRSLLFLLTLGLMAGLCPDASAQYSWTSARSVSGTDSSGVDTRTWAPGLSTGYFTFSYQFYTIPDSVVITFGGQPVYSSGGYVSGSATVSLTFGPSQPGTTPLLTVVMNPQGPKPGTAWDYTLTPTAKPVLQTITINGDAALGENASSIYTATASYSTGSTRTVNATWSSSSALLKISSAGTHIVALASGITKPVVAILSASYTEDGVTAKDTHNVALSNQTLTNNPTAEEKEDPKKGDESKVGGPVHTGTGAESFYKPLISISGVRSFEFGLHYSSSFSGITSPVGKGWSHPYSAFLTEAADSVSIRWSPTQANKYAFIKANSGGFYVCPDDDARFDVLEKTADGGFTLTKLDQTRYSFNSGGNLTEIANGRGQRVVVVTSAGFISSITEPVSGVSLTFTYASSQLTRVADNAGRDVEFAYLSGGLLGTITDVNGNVHTYAYNAGGKLTSVIAPDGTVICQNTYDNLGRVISQDDALTTNSLMTFSYSETVKPGFVVTTVLDRTGAKSVFTHDQKMRLVSQTDPLGLTTTYTFDATGNMISVKDPLGRTTTTTYDARGNATRVLSPGGGEMVMTFDARNNTTSVTNAAGQTSTTVYDAANNPVQVVDFSGATITRTFNANSQMITETSPRGAVTTFAYIGGRLSSITDSLADLISYSYDNVGRVTSSTNGAGKVTTFAYRADGMVLEETHPLGGKMIYTYDLRDRLVTSTDEMGGVTTNAYNGIGNVISVTNPIGGVITREFDGEGRMTKETDELGRITRHQYDAGGRLVTLTSPLGNITTFKYDAAGNRTTITNPMGETVTNTFSTTDLPLTTKDALGRTVTLEEDVLGRVSKSTDALKRSTTTRYDAMGRVTQVTNPLGLTTKRTYDAEGNLTGVTNPAGAIVSFGYDNENHRTSVTTPGSRTTSYLYEDRGFISRMTEPSGQIVDSVYDDNGRLSSRTDAVGAATYTYDAKGRLLTVVENGKTITRTYDALDRLTQFNDGNSNTLLYGYDAVGNLTSLTYPDGKVVQYAYDAENRMTSVTDWVGRVTTYTYDKAGRLLRTTRPNGTKQQRTYDKGGQLTLLADTTATGAVICSFAFGFDAGGQITTQTRKPTEPLAVPVLATMAYDADDRLTNYEGQVVTHDLDGNMTNGPMGAGLDTFTYDARNRLTQAGGVIYRYDAENRRIESELTGATTAYVNNPNAPFWQVLTMRTGADPTTYCVYGLGLLYTETSNVPLYHHFDHLGSTVATTNALAAVTFATTYEAYGQRVAITPGTAPTPFLFVGELGIMSDSNGLNFCRARYYSPLVRRFVNADPLGLDGGPNLYAYANGNPLSFSDPLGLWGMPSSQQMIGVLKAFAGATETLAGVALGTATGVTGVGMVAGGAVALHGQDTFWAGISQARSGVPVDTYTSTGLQRAGLSKNAANVVDTTIGIVGSFGASAASSILRTSGGVVHLTSDAAAAGINGSQLMKGITYAGPASNAALKGWGVTLRTGLDPGTYAAVSLPTAAWRALSRVWGVGPITTWQASMGHLYSARGVLNLATGVFTRQSANWGQGTFYFIDVVINGVRYWAAVDGEK